MPGLPSFLSARRPPDSSNWFASASNYLRSPDLLVPCYFSLTLWYALLPPQAWRWNSQGFQKVFSLPLKLSILCIYFFSTEILHDRLFIHTHTHTHTLNSWILRDILPHRMFDNFWECVRKEINAHWKWHLYPLFYCNSLWKLANHVNAIHFRKEKRDITRNHKWAMSS